jgi:hypothetical protein
MKCRESKPLSDYYGAKVWTKRKSCKKCVAQQQISYRRRIETILSVSVLDTKHNKRHHGQYTYITKKKQYKLIDNVVCKLCMRCKEFKRPLYFVTDMTRSDNLSVYCISCKEENWLRQKYRNASSPNQLIEEEEVDEEMIKHNKVLDRIDKVGYDKWYWDSLAEEIEIENVSSNL